MFRLIKAFILLSLASTGWAAENQDLVKIIAIQDAKIRSLERKVPKVWFAEQIGTSQIATTSSWKTLSGLMLDIDLKEASDVIIEVNGGASVHSNNLHCNFAFELDGQRLGHPIYGDIIIMGVLGSHWQSVYRSRPVKNLAAGKHQITIAMRGEGNEPTFCYVDPAQDYSRLRLEARVISQ